MANVNNRNLLATYPIVDNVRIATEPEGMHAQLRDQTVSIFQLAKLGNALLDECFNLLRNARITFLQIFENSLAISERT